MESTELERADGQVGFAGIRRAGKISVIYHLKAHFSIHTSRGWRIKARKVVLNDVQQLNNDVQGVNTDVQQVNNDVQPVNNDVQQVNNNVQQVNNDFVVEV